MNSDNTQTNFESVVKAEIMDLEEEFMAKHIQVFKEKVEEVLAEGRLHFVVDFQKTKQIDSAGLECLLWAIETVQDNGGLMKVAGLSPTLQRVFEITQFDHIFEAYEDVIDAVRAFS